MNIKQNIKVLVKIVISAIILIFVLYNIDSTKILKVIKEIDFLFLLPIVICIPVSLLLMTAKWKIFFDKVLVLRFRRVLFVYWASDFINLFGLGALGSEVYKMALFTNKKKVLLSSLVDRFLSFYWYLLLALATIVTFVFLNLSGILRFIVSVLIYSLCVVISLLLLGIIEKYLLRIKNTKFNSFVSRVKYSNADLIRHAFLSFLFVVNNAIIYSFVFLALGLPSSFFEFLVFIPILVLAMTLPISFEGIGVRELLFLKFAQVNSLASEQALVGSFVIFFVSLVYRLTGVIPFFFVKSTVASAEVIEEIEQQNNIKV